MKEWNEELVTLLLEKEFDALDAIELATVLEVMTAEEYTHLRQSILYTQHTVKVPVAFPREKEILDHLKSAIIKRPTNGWMQQLLQIKTAAWKTAVFTLICCAATGWYMRKSPITPLEQSLPVTEKLIDTFTREIYIRDTIYVNKNIYIKIPANQPVSHNFNMAFSNADFPAIHLPTDTSQHRLPNQVLEGISIEDAPELNVFFTGIQ